MTAKAFEDKQTAGQNRGQRDPSTWTEKAERTVFVRVYKRRFLRKYDLPYDLVKQGKKAKNRRVAIIPVERDAKRVSQGGLEPPA